MAKLYPFSVQKHAHDIEFRKNRVWNTLRDMESGEVPWDDKKYDVLTAHLEEVQDLLDVILSCRNGRVVYLTGEQIGLAKEIVSWASNTRANTLIENGKHEWLQYC